MTLVQCDECTKRADINRAYQFGDGDNWEMQAVCLMIGRRLKFRNYWTYETNVHNINGPFRASMRL